MEQDKYLTLQQIAEYALVNSVVRLELWKPTSYNDYVISFEVENPTKYQQEVTDEVSSAQIIEERISYASGFFVDKHLIVTNFHVVQGRSSIIAKLGGKQEGFQIESVDAYDIENDLILLTVTGEGVPLTLGDSAEIKDENSICAVGYPNGNAEIIHGAVDGTRKRDQRIRMKIGTTGGSSGSPIFNHHGETIGVDASGDEVYSYSIPSNTLKELIKNTGESIPLKEWQKLPHIRTFTETQEGDKLQKQGEFRKAIAHYDSAIELNPEMIKAYVGRADARMELWAFGRGLVDLITLRRLDPVSFSLSNFRKYVSWKRRGVWIRGGYLLILFLRTIFGKYGWYRSKGHAKIGIANSEAKKGDKTKVKMIYQESISDFTEGITLKPKVAGTYNSRGWAKYLLGKFETEHGNQVEAQELYQETISDAESALELATKDSKSKAAYYHTRGAAKAGLGDHDGAIADFSQCIQLRPKKALYYHDRGLSKQALGQQKAAEVDFDKAKELDPKFQNKSTHE